MKAVPLDPEVPVAPGVPTVEEEQAVTANPARRTVRTTRRRRSANVMGPSLRLSLRLTVLPRKTRTLHFQLSAPDGTPVLVFGYGHSAFDTYVDTLFRGLLGSEQAFQ